MQLFDRHFGTCSGLLAAGALAVFTLASPLAGQKPAVAAASTPKVARAAARPAPGGLRTGIQVHGRWTIVVKNPDGSIAAKRVFENSLVLDGSNLLPIILGRFATAGAWDVILGTSSNNPGPCNASTGQSVNALTPAGSSDGFNAPCYIVESNGLHNGDLGCSNTSFATMWGCTADLKVALVNEGTVGADQLIALQLQGTAALTTVVPGQIDEVGTELTPCTGTDEHAFPITNLASPSTVSPAACISTPYSTGGHPLFSQFNETEWPFTATAIPGAPIDVVPGQSVMVTVVISFS
jgi:hypothetical protein